MRLPVFAATALCALATPVHAQEVIGTISGTIDGVPMEWQTFELRSEGTATAEFRTLGPGMVTISIQGHDVNSDRRMENVLAIGTTLMGEGAQRSSLGDELSFFPEGMSGPFYAADGEGTSVDLEWESLDVSRPNGQASGRFSGVLCEHETMMSPINPDRCFTVEGTFDTSLISAD